jgi:hypothetical protein
MLSVTGTSDVDTTVSIILILKIIYYSYSKIASPDGLFENTHSTDPVAVGYYNNCSSSDAAGNISAVSNSMKTI